MIFQLLVFVHFVTTAFSSPINPHLVCEGKRWESIFTFFTTNYIAHAFTIIPDPGATWFAQTVFSFSALMVPNIGLIGAISSVMSYFLQGRSGDLHRALAQNALVILVRTEDIRAGDMEIDIKTTSKFNSRQVHGNITIPDGYALIVPSQSQHLDEMKPALRESKGIKLCRSKELTSAVVGIAQVIFSIITIYRTRGDQIEKYGYAAYGLSVYPYALMSVANLIKLGVCGRYPYAYVLRTATLVEAEKNGGVFSGTVGDFGVNHEENDEVNDSQDSDSMNFSDPPPWTKRLSFPWLKPLGDYRGCRWIVPIIGSLIFLIAVPSHLIFIYLVSGPKVTLNTRGQKIWTPNTGQSTRAQRVWMLGWPSANGFALVVDLVASSGFRFGRNGLERWVSFFFYVSVFIAYAFAIGGFVTVGGMLHAESSYQPC